MCAFCRIGRKPLAAMVMACGFWLAPLAMGTAEEAKKIDGRELFTREWIPGDARSHGGDGLGPVFNDTSCVACHNQEASAAQGRQQRT